MTDVAMDDRIADTDGILLAAIGDAYLLLDGEAHLDAMLSGRAPFPKPVRCLRLPSMQRLYALLPDAPDPSSLWRIHPAIVERLKQNEELVFIDLAETA